MSFEGKVILVTGGSAGVGAATAFLFAKEGANVAIVGRNEAKLNNVAAECAKVGKTPLVIKADVSKDDEAKNIVKKTVDTWGKLDVLINNAGILRFAGILEDNLLDVFDELLNTNLRAVILITNLAAPYLVKTKGNIINVSSVAANTVIKPGFSPYSVTKIGLDHFTRGCALELASHGVRVNAVNLGPVRTGLFVAGGVPEFLEEVERMTALKKAAEPEEIADLIFYLAGDKAKSVTGVNYVIDNGMLLM